MSWANKVAVVTGASSGLGEALTKGLAAEGCAVGLIARREDRLAELAMEIRRNGGKTASCPADVSDRSQILAAVAKIAEELGPIDLLIANAGVGKSDCLVPLSVDDIEEMIRVNLLGVIYSIEAVLPEMQRRGRGQIAGVSSMGAYKGLPASGGYCASKAGVNIFLEALRIQLRGSGIAVTTICPGFIRTPMTAPNAFRMPWLLEPEDAARKIIRALRRKRKVYNFPWQMAILMRLLGCLPDWLVARALPRKSDEKPR